MSLTQLTATQMAEQLRAGGATAVRLVTPRLDAASDAYVHINRDDAERAADIDAGKTIHRARTRGAIDVIITATCNWCRLGLPGELGFYTEATVVTQREMDTKLGTRVLFGMTMIRR